MPIKNLFRPKEVNNVFEVAREKMYTKEQNSEKVKEKIIELLRINKFSLSQIRTLFIEIVANLEDEPLK